jgi:uncharacterized protein YbjT (DUF2867 family)
MATAGPPDRTPEGGPGRRSDASDSTVLVTGANGYIGSHLVRRLASAGQSVRAMVRSRDRVDLPDGVEVVQADVTKPETLGPAVEGVTVVVHAAALVANLKEPYRGAYQAVNLRGTQSLVEAAQRAKVERFVLLSGMDTQPGKAGSYMATRWGMEEAVRQGGIPYVILQPSVLFGDGAPFVTELAKLARMFPVVPAIGGGGVMFQPIWVEDVVSCLVACVDRPDLLGGAYPVGGAEQVSFRQIIQALGRAMGKHRTTVTLPVPVARAVAACMMAALSHPPLTPASIELFTLKQTTELDAVHRDFGVEPRGFVTQLSPTGIVVDQEVRGEKSQRKRP